MPKEFGEYEKHDSIFLYWLTLRKEGKVTDLNLKDNKYWKLEKQDELNTKDKLFIDPTLFDKE